MHASLTRIAAPPGRCAGGTELLETAANPAFPAFRSIP